MSGKGSKPRPFSVSQEHYASEYDRIFGHSKTPVADKAEINQNDKVDILPDKKLINPAPNARHDEVYQGGVRWLDELAGNGDTFEEASNVNDEMKLHQEKMEEK